MSKSVLIPEEVARLIDRAFLPTNPNKLRFRTAAQRETRDQLRDACHHFREALATQSLEDAPAVVVQVSGGVVQHVVTPHGIIVKVVNYDAAEGPDKDEHGSPCEISTWPRE